MYKIIDSFFIIICISLAMTANLWTGENIVLAKTLSQPSAKPSNYAKQNHSASTSQLGPEMHVGSYKIKPPKNFVLKENSKQGAQELYMWERPATTGKIPPRLIIKMAPRMFSMGSLNEAKLKYLYNAFVGGMKISIGLTNFRHDPPEVVTINDIPMARGRWSGMLSNANNCPIYGFSYYADIPDKQIVITGITSGSPSFQLLEASAVTFHK